LHHQKKASVGLADIAELLDWLVHAIVEVVVA
jgi:hypothetical protein